MQKNSLLIPSNITSSNSQRRKDNSYIHTTSNISPNKNYLKIFDSKTLYAANTNNKRKITDDKETKTNIKNIKNIKYSGVNGNNSKIANDNKRGAKNGVKRESIVGKNEKNKLNNIFKDKKNIIKNNNNNNNKKQRNNNNHSFFESKYILEPKNSFFDYSNRKTVNKNPTNTYINMANKENINLSNIFPAKNVVKKHIILNVDQISNKNNELTHFPTNKKPLTPLVTISIKNTNKILNTASKAIQIKNKENEKSEDKNINSIYFISNYNDNNKRINPSNSFDKISINKISKKVNRNENKNLIIELNNPIKSVLNYSLSPNNNQKNSSLYNNFTFKKQSSNIKINQDLEKENSSVFQKNIKMNSEVWLDNELNYINMTNNLLYMTNNDKIYENSTLKRTKNYFNISNISEYISNSNKNLTINTDIKSNVYESTNKSSKIISIVKSNLFNNNNNNRKKIDSNKNNYTLRTNKKIDNSRKLDTYDTNTLNIKKSNMREKGYLITHKRNEYNSMTVEIDKHKKIKSNNELTIIPKKTFVNPYLRNNINYIKSCNSISVSGIDEFGHKKLNQDTLLIERNINGIFNFNIFGVLDGHGEDGHYVSQFVRGFIINSIKNNTIIKKCSTPKEIYEKLISDKYKLIEKAFLDADMEIRKEKFDYKGSGTTCIIIIQLEQKIICANSGDSRAIIVYKNKSKKITKIFPLSYDCKPELPNERKRIYEHGGVVEKTKIENEVEEDGPYRVYEKGKDYPGLAMSRSIGDIDAKKLGVIPNPQIIEYIINDDTNYMIICSDGVWEFISNEEAMTIANEYYIKNNPTGLCQCLYETSFKYWNEDDGLAVDDISAIVVFF